jgi:hypothetical protein
MRLKSLALAFVTTLLLAPMTARAGDADCDKRDKPCGMPCCAEETMSCCAKEPEPIASVIDILTMNMQYDLPELASPRQTAVVWFHRPVRIGRTVLMGKYVIEHDTDRQARGEPCTHIYAADKPTVPVVTFHCTHLEDTASEHDTVVLQALPDGMRTLLRFQFAGESGAHGFPAGH